LIKPSLDALLSRVDSKYTLVTLVAKRARQLVDGDVPLVNAQGNNPVTIALTEIIEGKVGYHKTRSGAK